MSSVRRLLDQIEKFRLPNLPVGEAPEATSSSDPAGIFGGMNSASTGGAQNNELDFLGGGNSSSSVPVGKANDPFGSSN